MKKPARDIRTFLVDTNAFIAAVKNPQKHTNTLGLLLRIIDDPSIMLVGNDLLVEEMLRYAQLFRSETALTILSALLAKTDMVDIKGNYIKACRPYISTPDKADVLHAATCLQTGSILITNDEHFDRIKEEGIIEVWDILEAIGDLEGATRRR